MSRKLDEVSLPVTINDHLFNDFDRPQVIDGKVIVTIRRLRSKDDGSVVQIEDDGSVVQIEDDGFVVQIEELTLVSFNAWRILGHLFTPIVGCEILAVSLLLPLTVSGVKFTEYYDEQMVDGKSVSFVPLLDGKGCIVNIQELQKKTLKTISIDTIADFYDYVNPECLSDWTPLAAGTEILPLKCELPLVVGGVMFAEYNVEQKVGVYSVSFRLPQPGQTGCVAYISS
jgi:hypothetical protein